MIERRKLKRRRTRFPAAVLERESNRFVGHLANITTEGIMLQTEQPLDIDVIYRFMIDLPDEIKGHNVLDLDAHSLWCNRAPDPAYYRSGLELINLTAEQTELIELLIKDAVFERLVS